MKIIRFVFHDLNKIKFGGVVADRAVAFSDIEEKQGHGRVGYLDNSIGYLHNLPDSERRAKELLAWANENLDVFVDNEKPLLTQG